MPLTISVGTQYAAVSDLSRHVVSPEARSAAGVEFAFVAVLPKYVWSCERPACRKKTIGSSWLRWLNPQATAK